MKKSGFLCRILCLLFTLVFLLLPTCVYANTGLDMSVTRGCHSIDAQMPMLGSSDKIENVYSAFLYDYTNDTLIYAQNPDQQYDPASLVKIMTGLIIAEQGNLDDQVTVSVMALDELPTNSLGVDLKDGEVISLRDLLYCILVDSANDASVIAAQHVCGSVEGFVQEMNRYAIELGCKDTTFTNVHGLFDEFQVSTARDIARILTKAAKNETFMQAFSTVNYTVPATNLSEARELSSSNYLMNDDMMTIYLDSRVTGGRAGVMDTGERSLAVTAERNDVKLVSVVIGSLSEIKDDGYTVITFGSFNETSELLNLGFQGHHSVQLFYKDQALKQYEVKDGDSYIATGVFEDVKALLPYGVTYNDLSYRYNEDTTNIQAPVKKGDLISTVQVWHKELCLAQANLYALHDVEIRQITATETIIEEERVDASSLLIIVGIIVGLLVLLLFGRRFIFRLVRKHQMRRYRKNRRRSR